MTSIQTHLRRPSRKPGSFANSVDPDERFTFSSRKVVLINYNLAVSYL
jgi:hypothetical protein